MAWRVLYSHFLCKSYAGEKGFIQLAAPGCSPTLAGSQGENLKQPLTRRQRQREVRAHMSLMKLAFSTLIQSRVPNQGMDAIHFPAGSSHIKEEN